MIASSFQNNRWVDIIVRINFFPTPLKWTLFDVVHSFQNGPDICNISIHLIISKERLFMPFWE